jgi:hypothetical protein
VVLLLLGMILIFAATLDQVNLGVWGVQQKYFHALFVLVHVSDVPVPVFPGGYLLGGLLLINLIAAHFYRFRFSWRKLGIWFAHVGLILLLLGELFSGLWQEVYQMRIDQGETVRFSEHERRNELAITDTTDPKMDDVVAIPEHLLAAQEPVQHPKLPFRVVTKAYYPNSITQPRAQAADAPAFPATTGTFAERYAVRPLPLTYKEDERNIPAAAVELVGPSGSLGTWLVTTYTPVLRDDGTGAMVPRLVTAGPQRFEYNGHTWTIALRPERKYHPFSVTLLELRHDVYQGTEIPKNYSSRVRVTSDDGRDVHETLIYMNNPMRYGGLTFYQFQMNSPEHYTVLQVVRNPSWVMPYIACALITLGLIVQFGIHLIGFAGKRRALAASAA